jgi:hypothetical protein
VILVLCKSLGPLVYSVVLGPVVLFMRPRTWVKIACAILLFVCAYPLLRSTGFAPVQTISTAANMVSKDRQESFQTRVNNEYQLLAKANEKPLFGWGTWGRNRVYDRSTGKDISITDGEWIIQFGMFGWFGYLSLFGLLATAGFRAYRTIGDQVTPATISLAGLALLLAVYVADMIPNGSTMALTFLLAGSIASSAKARASRPIRQRTARQIGPAPHPAAP